MTLRRGSLPFPISLIVGSAIAIACGSNDGSDGNQPPAGGQTGEEDFGCQPVERDMLAWSERSALGFSADELLNAVGSDNSDRLTWSDGGGTPLTLGIERATSGSVEFQTREYTSDGSGAEPATEIATECNDVVAIPVTLSFTTTDGTFAEQVPLTLLAESTTTSPPTPRSTSTTSKAASASRRSIPAASIACWRSFS